MKKIVALVMALVLALSLSVVAFAADDLDGSDGKAEVTISSLLALPTISVKFGNPGDIIVNPYGMTVQYDTNQALGNATIISTPNLITNSSDIKLTLTALPTFKADGEGSGVVENKTTDLTGEEDKPTVHLEMRMNAVGEGTTTAPAGVSWSDVDLKIQMGQTTNNSVQLDANTSANNENTNALWQIVGQSGGTGWQTTHTFTVSIVFKIEPVLNGGGTYTFSNTTNPTATTDPT